jgi:hypothetical protein
VLSDKPSVQTEADGSPPPTPVEPASPPPIPEALKPIYELQRVVEAQCKQLVEIQRILGSKSDPDPGERRLKKINRLLVQVKVKWDDILKWVRAISISHTIFENLSADYATEWLDKVRSLVDSLCRDLDTCLRDVNVLLELHQQDRSKCLFDTREHTKNVYDKCKMFKNILDLFSEKLLIFKNQR